MTLLPLVLLAQVVVDATTTVLPLALPPGATAVARGALFDARAGDLVDAVGLLDLEAGGLVAVARDPEARVYRLAPSGRPCRVDACPALVVNLLPLGTARLASVEELRARLVGQIEVAIEAPPTVAARLASAARAPELPIALGLGLGGVSALLWRRRIRRRPTARAEHALMRIHRASQPVHAAVRETAAAVTARVRALEGYARGLRRAARRAVPAARPPILEQARRAAARAAALAARLEQTAAELALPSAPPVEAPLVAALEEELGRARAAASEAEALLDA